MSNAMGKVLPIVMLMFIFVLFGSYATGILSNADDNAQISEGHQDQYETTIKVQNASLSLLAPIGLIFGVLILIFGLKALTNKR